MQKEKIKEENEDYEEVENVAINVDISAMDIDGDGDIDDVNSSVANSTVSQRNKRNGMSKNSTLCNIGNRRTVAGVRYSYSADEQEKERRLFKMSLEERIRNAQIQAAEKRRDVVKEKEVDTREIR